MDQTVVQILIALASVIVSGVVTFVIAILLKVTMGWRVAEDAEVVGIDQEEHAESAYEFATRGARMGHTAGASEARKSEDSLDLEGAK